MDVLLVGGAGGLGKAAAEYLAERGVRVFCCDIAEQKNTADNIIPLLVDITDQESITKAYNEVSKVSDSLSAIISIAGIYIMDSFVEIEEYNLKNIIDVNLMGVYRIDKTFLPLLKKSGRIIITTSELAGQKPLPFNGIYTMTKTALECYADSLRLELAFLGYKVITVKPGAFDTQMSSKTNSQANSLMKNTKLNKMSTKRFVDIINSQTGTAKDPEVLAKVLYKALIKKIPKLTYYKNAGIGLKFYSILPRRLQGFVLRKMLHA